MPNASQKQTTLLPLGKGLYSAMHRFCGSSDARPILLIHGSIEDSRIFHSRSGKGLAPYLAANGFDVFAPDLAGKGESTPVVKRGFKHSQHEFISRDMNIYIDHIRQLHPGKPIHLGAHSWGGVLLLAWMARYMGTVELAPSVFFASKRRIAVWSARRFFMVDVMWTAVGSVATAVKGYLPAKSIGLSSDNEPALFYRQVNRWVYQPNWTDGSDRFDYSARLHDITLPPILYLAGVNDHVLGHPRDVQRLLKESGQVNARFTLLGKTAGFAKDYGHIDILTDAGCAADHFPMVLKWLQHGM